MNQIRVLLTLVFAISTVSLSAQAKLCPNLFQSTERGQHGTPREVTVENRADGTRYTIADVIHHAVSPDGNTLLSLRPGGVLRLDEIGGNRKTIKSTRLPSMNDPDPLQRNPNALKYSDNGKYIVLEYRDRVHLFDGLLNPIRNIPAYQLTTTVFGSDRLLVSKTREIIVVDLKRHHEDVVLRSPVALPMTRDASFVLKLVDNDRVLFVQTDEGSAFIDIEAERVSKGIPRAE